MKTLFAVLFLSSSVIACDNGCTPYEGVCACNATSKDVPDKETTQPSDEKPSKNPIPAYMREHLKFGDGKSAKEPNQARTPDDQSYKLPNGGVPVRE